MKEFPSYNTEETFPKLDDAIAPDIISMRSCSMMLFASCVSCNGTNASCAMLLELSKPESSHVR
jgi:hypothetical protein